MTESKSTNNERRQRLAHVLWIGGGTDAGKTTVAEALVKRHGFAYYNFDRNERSHIERMAAAGDYDSNPQRKNPYELTPDELWVDPEPTEMAAGILRGWARRAEFAIADLLALPADTTIVAEGPGFFPDIVAPLLSSNHQAIWFVPERSFKRKIAVQRGKPSVRLQTSDPQRATESIIARDLLVADAIRAQALAHGLPLHETDGSLSIERTIAMVEQHFARYVPIIST